MIRSVVEFHASKISATEKKLAPSASVASISFGSIIGGFDFH